MKRFNVFKCLILSFLAIGIFGLKVINVSAEEMGFSVKAIPSERQRDKKQTYFDLRVTPNTKEVIQVEVQNNTEALMTVLVDTNTAVTNNNGVIDYSQTEPTFDESLKYPLSKMVDYQSEVPLKAKESKVIDIAINIPSEPFDGIILGGIHFSQKENEDIKKEDSSVQVKNKFSYVVGIRLSENDNELKPHVNLLEVSAGQKNYRNTILATLQNTEAQILNGMIVEAYVYEEKNTKEALFYEKSENLEMAPNSSFEFGISTVNKPFKAGKYLLKMTVTTKGETFEFSEPFEIKSVEAKKYNEEAVELVEQKNDNKILLMTIIVLSLVIIILIGWLFVKKQQEKKRKRQRKLKKKTHR